MSRLANKVAIVVGAGQTPGETIGNGRATAITFAREGAKCLLVDKDAERAEETCAMIEAEGGTAEICAADITREADCERIASACVEHFGRIDILHNNVGIGGGDAGPTHIKAEDWDRIFAVNTKAVAMTCKHVVPIMRQQKSGVVLNVSSVAATCSVGIVAYKASKAALNAYSHSLAIGNAKHGIRVNVISPGLMDTPMAIEGISKARGIPKEDLRALRNAQVPLDGGMGDAWDVANAALFLASDEAKFITGIVLPVDGGQSALVGG